MQKKKMLQEFLGHRFLVFALFMLIFSGGLKAAEEEYQKNQVKELFKFWGKGQMNNTLTALFSEKGMEKESVELVKKWVDELDF